MAKRFDLGDRKDLLDRAFKTARFDEDTRRTSRSDHDQRRELHDNLQVARPDEITILSDVLVLADAKPYVAEIMGGAHVIISDNGERYRAWKTLASVDDRNSSHKSDDTQYHVDGPLCHTILFSKFGGYTWVQLENNPFEFSLHLLGHTVDFLAYQLTGRNQGPYGSSQFTDDHPLRLSPAQWCDGPPGLCEPYAVGGRTRWCGDGPPGLCD
jgi:hypothetical protein